MTAEQKAELMRLLTELRDALPLQGTRPEDLAPYRKLHEIRVAIESVSQEMAQ
jgi:hypothetical protein